MKNQHPILDLCSQAKPRERLLISEWVEKYAFNPFKPENGKFHIRRMPWQVEALDDPLAAGVSEIVWKWGRRLGKSMLVGLIVEYFIQHDPSPILVKYPTIDAGKKWMRGQLMKLIAVTPCMAGLLKSTRSRDAESTMMDRYFQNEHGAGDLTIIGANSPAGLRQLNKRIVLQEEIDADEVSAEGDAVALADGRAENFYNAVLLKTSTPGMEGASRITEIYDRSDKRCFYIPCAHCADYFALDRGQLRFSFATQLPNRDGSPRGPGEIRDTVNARLVCPHCGWELNDQERIAGINDTTAHWKATAPFSGVLGRHLNGMYRIMGLKAYSSYLHEFSEMWLKAKHGGRETIRVHVNNFDANAFADDSEKVEWKTLKDRAEDYGPDLPLAAMFITGGMDIHPDRAEIIFYGHGPDNESWALECKVFYGDFDMPVFNQRIEQFIVNKRFNHPVLGEMNVGAMGVDSGHKTKSVYLFCKRNRMRNFYAVKGSDSNIGALVTRTTERTVGLTRFNANSDAFKNEVAARLQNQYPGPGYIHFPTEEAGGVKTAFNSEFFVQLCSEERKRKLVKGRWVTHWEKKTSASRNEKWDITLYAFVALEISQRSDWIARKFMEMEQKIKEDGMNREASKDESEISAKPHESLPEPAKSTGRQPARNPNFDLDNSRTWPTGAGIFNPLKV